MWRGFRPFERLVGVLFHEGVSDAVGLATELQEPAVVDDAVDDRGGHLVVSEHGAPAGELEVRGQDEAAFLVGIGDDLEQQSCAFRVDREVSELVDRDELVSAEGGEFTIKSAVVFRVS